MTPSRKAFFVAGFAAVLLGLAFGHARLLSQPPSWLVGIVADDAFYYLQTARHIASGHGSTFDGIHPTSGYHPVWMALVVPLAAAAPESGALLRGALALEFLLHAATAFAMIGLFRRFMSPGMAVAGALCWLANPFALYLALQGVESALYMLALVLLLRTAFSFVEGPATLRSHLRLGGALALCFLARTEAGILAAVTCAVLPAFRGLRPWNGSYLRSAFLIAATFSLCALPWFLYCWMETGSPFQSSGVAKALWSRESLDALSTPERLARVTDAAGRWLAAPWIGPVELPFERVITLIAMVSATAGLLLVARRPLADLPLIAWSAWLLGATLLTGLVYGLFYWDMPVWYRAQPSLLLFIITYRWIARAAAASRYGAAIFGTGVPLLLLTLSLFASWLFYRYPPAPYLWQRDIYHSQAAFERLVPPGETIGCFNAGIPAFFGRRRVVNLDGLVNASVVPYFRERNLERYFTDEGIRYLADDRYSLANAQRFMGRPLRLRPLASVPLRAWPAPRRWLWRVE